MKNLSATYLLIIRGEAIGLFKSYNEISIYLKKSITEIDNMWKNPTLDKAVFRFEPEQKIPKKVKFGKFEISV